jgi:hypothetical protein
VILSHPEAAPWQPNLALGVCGRCCLTWPHCTAAHGDPDRALLGRLDHRQIWGAGGSAHGHCIWHGASPPLPIRQTVPEYTRLSAKAAFLPSFSLKDRNFSRKVSDGRFFFRNHVLCGRARNQELVITCFTHCAKLSILKENWRIAGS